MSERSSFTTEYIDCEKCLAAVSPILLKSEKYLCSSLVPSWIKGQTLPIIAGKIGASYPGEEFSIFESSFIPALETAICHPLRIAVLAESGASEIFAIVPLRNQP